MHRSLCVAVALGLLASADAFALTLFLARTALQTRAASTGFKPAGVSGMSLRDSGSKRGRAVTLPKMTVTDLSQMDYDTVGTFLCVVCFLLLATGVPEVVTLWVCRQILQAPHHTSGSSSPEVWKVVTRMARG